MSHAEYAPKQVPVLTRLVTALRQIPAVEFAVAKFRALLRGRTNTERVIASEFVAATPEIANDSLAPAQADTAETEHAATDTVAVDPIELVATEVEPVAAETIEPVATETVESGTARAIPAEIEIVEIEATESTTVEQAPAATEIIETVAGQTVAIETDSVDVEAAEPAIAEVVPGAPDIVESSVIQAAPVEVDTVALLAVEPETVATQPAEVDIVAFAVVADDLVEPVSVVADVATSVAQPSGLSEREELIRRRWKETGVRMWNARTHGAGQGVLCIQGRVALLPPKPGETMPQYDRLEFRLVEGRILCEDFEVDAPEAPRHRAFANAAG